MIRITILAVALLIAATLPALAQDDATILFFRPEAVDGAIGPGGGAGEETAAESGNGVGKVVRGLRKILRSNTAGDSDQNPTIYFISNGGNKKLATIAKGEFFTLPVRAGIHAFSWTGAPSRGQQTILNVSPGQQIFLEVQFRSITQITTDTAAIDFRALRPINATRVFDSAVRVPVDGVRPAQTATATSNAPGQLPQPSPQPPAPIQQQTAPSQQASTEQQVSAPNDDPPKTIESVRQKYLNQVIIVGGSVRGATLLEWSAARKSGDRYRSEMQRHVPAKYRGLTARVIAVESSDAALTTSEVQNRNALGEVLIKNDTGKSNVDLVVQFKDGTLAMTSTHFQLLSVHVKLVSEQAKREEEMAANLPLVIGKSLYATGFSTLYEADTTLEDLAGPREVLKRMSVTQISVFEPLQIVTAKYIPAEDGVVFKVKLPNGREALTFTNQAHLGIASSDTPFIKKISGSLLAAIPNELTSKEVAAIKQGEIFLGMSGDAVFYAFGLPEKENDWGSGGKQRIYLKTISVFFDNQNKVVDWQVLDR